MLQDRCGWTILIIWTAMTAAGCTQSAAPSVPVVPKPNASTKAVEQLLTATEGILADEDRGYTPPPDESLTTDEYIKLGMPAPDRLWMSPDFVEANKAFGKVVDSKLGQLPRYQSEKSGEVFARMVNLENLAFNRNSAVAIHLRIGNAANQFVAVGQLYQQYVIAHMNRATGDSEVVEITGLFLRFIPMQFELMDEFMLTVDKNSPMYPTRLAARQRIISGAAMFVAGTINSLTEFKLYRVSELQRQIGYMKEMFPKILPRLSDNARFETKVRLANLAQTHPSSILRQEILSLSEIVNQLPETGTE